MSYLLSRLLGLLGHDMRQYLWNRHGMGCLTVYKFKSVTSHGEEPQRPCSSSQNIRKRGREEAMDFANVIYSAHQYFVGIVLIGEVHFVILK